MKGNGIDVSFALRSYLEKLAWKAEGKQNLKELHRLVESEVKPSRKGFAVGSIREDRDRAHRVRSKCLGRDA